VSACGLVPARVLIVDDDDFVREVLAQLEAAGFATLVASSGGEAPPCWGRGRRWMS
jgi:CheY-like chemotaxis protein